MVLYNFPDWFLYVFYGTIGAASLMGMLTAYFGYTYFKAGQFGRAYARLRRKSNVGMVEIGMDRIRMRPLTSDGINALDEQAMKMYSMKQEGKYVTSDGAVLFLNYAPIAATISARVIATVGKMTEKDKDDLLKSIDDYSEKQLQIGVSIPLQNANGKPLLDSEGRAVVRPPTAKTELELPTLSDTPIDKGKLSPKQVFNEVVEYTKGHSGFLLSVKEVFEFLVGGSPFDLRAAWNAGYAQAKDEDRKRFKGADIVKYFAIGIMVMLMCFGFAFLWSVVVK